MRADPLHLRTLIRVLVSCQFCRGWSPFAKKMPALVFPHLHKHNKILPILSTMELSRDHLQVPVALLHILCDAISCHNDMSISLRCNTHTYTEEDYHPGPIYIYIYIIFMDLDG